MAWQEIKNSWVQLLEMAGNPATDHTQLISGWDLFKNEVLRCSDRPPYHLYCILKEIENRCGRPPAPDKTILDHGCGSGLTIFYLAVLGYENLYGVDLKDFSRQDRIVEAIGRRDLKLISYDGKSLPFADQSLDFIFSQQVLEHVHDDQLEMYYREEARVLREGGAALHEVPHRLVPYESHNQVWLLHYLPKGIADRLLPLFMGERKPLAALYHRWPWHHREKAREIIGSCKDLTIERLRNTTDFEYYDGPAGARRLLNKILGVPVIGRALEPLLGNLVMLETLSVKTSLDKQT